MAKKQIAKFWKTGSSILNDIQQGEQVAVKHIKDHAN